MIVGGDYIIVVGTLRMPGNFRVILIRVQTEVIMIIHKILKVLPPKFETLIRIVRNERKPHTLSSLSTRLHMEETEVRLKSQIRSS